MVASIGKYIIHLVSPVLVNFVKEWQERYQEPED